MAMTNQKLGRIRALGTTLTSRTRRQAYARVRRDIRLTIVTEDEILAHELVCFLKLAGQQSLGQQ